MLALFLACLAWVPSTGPSHHVMLLDAYGTPGHVEVRGRVLEEAARPPPNLKAGSLRNLRDNVEQLEDEGVEHAQLQLRIGEATHTLTTDEAGRFELILDGPDVKVPAATLTVHVHVTQPSDVADVDGPLYVVPDGPTVVLVSDVDDTVLQTHVREKRKLVKTVLFKNAAQVEPVPGAPQAYREAVAAGVTAVFYLSGSPQGFHDRIAAALALHGFPDGPILLKDFSRESPTHQESYKRGRLDVLAARLPQARFILVGDSGEKDPEIYRAFAAAYPGRVVGIVIRQTPAAPASRERLVDCRVVQDHALQPGLLAAMARASVEKK